VPGVLDSTLTEKTPASDVPPEQQIQADKIDAKVAFPFFVEPDSSTSLYDAYLAEERDMLWGGEERHPKGPTAETAHLDLRQFQPRRYTWLVFLEDAYSFTGILGIVGSIVLFVLNSSTAERQ
jgi:hypothetical protein